jgi:hypothetical protein
LEIYERHESDGFVCVISNEKLLPDAVFKHTKTL